MKNKTPTELQKSSEKSARLWTEYLVFSSSRAYPTRARVLREPSKTCWAGRDWQRALCWPACSVHQPFPSGIETVIQTRSCLFFLFTSQGLLIHGSNVWICKRALVISLVKCSLKMSLCNFFVWTRGPRIGLNQTDRQTGRNQIHIFRITFLLTLIQNVLCSLVSKMFQLRSGKS